MSVADYQRIMDAIQKLGERLDALTVARMNDRRDLDMAIDAISELQPAQVKQPRHAAR